MTILTSLSDLKLWRENKSLVGFVPTMGALHKGHLSLIKAAQKSSDEVIVSIFVNPTQFNEKEDFTKYPRKTEKDLQLLENQGVDAVWLPQVSDLYPYEPAMKIVETDLSTKLCGAYRPGHFDGVLTVVMKLFQLVRPKRAFFGEKDYQQLLLIQKMVKEFFLDVEIIPVPTQREESGLALSSRNLRLNEKERKQSAFIYQILKEAKSSKEARQKLEAQDFKVEYVEDMDHRRFAAAWVGGVRLIDNVEI